MNLPRELQYITLEYTDLVTPCREIPWNPKERFHLHYRLESCGLPNPSPPPVRISTLVSFGIAGSA